MILFQGSYEYVDIKRRISIVESIIIMLRRKNTSFIFLLLNFSSLDKILAMDIFEKDEVKLFVSSRKVYVRLSIMMTKAFECNPHGLINILKTTIVTTYHLLPYINLDLLFKYKKKIL